MARSEEASTGRNAKIIKEILKGRKTILQIAKEFGVDERTVRRIRDTFPYNENRPFNPGDSIIRSDALKIINKKKSGFTTQYLAGRLNISEQNTKELIDHLYHHDGYNIIMKGDGQYALVDTLPPQSPLDLKRLHGEDFAFGLISDTHLCNKHSRIDVLEAAYDTFASRKIKDVFHAGNLIDGEFKYNRYELLAHGVHDQCQYLADVYPQKTGITTWFITGECHEGWYQKDVGLRIGFYIQRWCENCGRKDLVHIGHIEQDIILEQPNGQTRIRIMHPGGGSAYATSYPSQKMVESFQGGEKPHMLILGHFHKFDVSYPREVPTIQAGCVQDQTPFMRKHHLAAEVGFLIVKIGSRIDGTIGRINVEWFPFFDRKYHQRLNESSIILKK